MNRSSINNRVRVFNQRRVKSTQLLAFDYLNFGFKPPFIITAKEQTKAIGRGQNKWNDYFGSIKFSLVTNALIKNSSFSLDAGLMVIYVIEKLYPSLRKKLTLKWPNDIYFGNKKLCGIRVDRVNNNYTIIGVGINIFANSGNFENLQSIIDEKEFDYDSANFMKKNYDFCKLFYREFIAYMSKNSLSYGHRYWNEYGFAINKKIFFENENLYHSFYRGIDKNGFLRLYLNGRERSFNNGKMII